MKFDDCKLFIVSLYYGIMKIQIMSEKVKLVDATVENAGQFAICGYKNPKNEGYKRKIEWIKQQLKNGLRYKFLVSGEKGAVGAIEYLPGEFAWRPVNAKNYMFIQCIYIMSKAFKGKGFGQIMLEACIEYAKNDKMNGVTVVTRKGTWMADKDLFEKNGFEVIDKAKPDFELMVKKFDKNAPDPAFKAVASEISERYKNGLFIITSDQCAYTAKAINDITKAAKEELNMEANVVQLSNHKEAQESPCAFGTFCIVYNGSVIAGHPISKRRFLNIMTKNK